LRENKNHWYDGWIYDKLIAPNQDRLFKQIRNLIETGSTVIDVGCGTGRFSFFVADKCSSITGIDLSKRNINHAESLLLKNPITNISFRHTSIDEILLNGSHHFHYAVMTYVIHEVNPDERSALLTSVSKIADKIIIGDYLYPAKSGLWNLINEVVEFGAGKDHYRNYKSFMSSGGIGGVVSQSNLKVFKEVKNRPTTSHIVVLLT
jgi:SAM-dependent methyltransferase